MLFKVFVTFVWFLATAFVTFCILEIAHSQLDMFSKIFLYIVGVFAETFVSVLLVEGMGI
jgi:hypothetical protein